MDGNGSEGRGRPESWPAATAEVDDAGDDSVGDEATRLDSLLQQRDTDEAMLPVVLDPRGEGRDGGDVLDTGG